MGPVMDGAPEHLREFVNVGHDVKSQLGTTILNRSILGLIFGLMLLTCLCPNDSFGDVRGDIDLLPGKGNINFKMLIRTLREIGYDSYLLVQVYNIGTRIEIDGWALESLEYMRKLLNEK